MIEKKGKKWVVESHDGSRTFGSYMSKEQATHRLQQVEYFKHKAKTILGGG